MEGLSADDLERHRIGLTGFCYRMLGAAGEAEDAVQETLLKAWKAADGYDPARAALSTWLYRIATNVCLDQTRGARRRAVAMDLGPAATGPELGPPLPGRWVEPMPDARTLPDDPADLATLRESVRLAFVAALQQLPPRQRAVLILREVLTWPAAEVATLLDTTVASVNSTLQRARAALRRPAPVAPLDDEHRALLVRYVDAFERFDVATLTALLHEDATMTMPPFPGGCRAGTRSGSRWSTRMAPASAPDCCRRWPTARPPSGNISPTATSSGRSRSTCWNWPAAGSSTRPRSSTPPRTFRGSGCRR